MLLFWMTCGIFVIYGIGGNLLYRCEITPKLGVNPSFWPSEQLKHIQAYVAVCEQKREHPWFLPLLRHIKILIFIMFGLLGILILFGPFLGIPYR